MHLSYTIKRYLIRFENTINLSALSNQTLTSIRYTVYQQTLQHFQNTTLHHNFRLTISIFQRRRSDFESGGALSLWHEAPENFYTVPLHFYIMPSLTCRHGWVRAS